MKTFILVLLFCLPSMAQNTLTVTGPLNARPGQTVTLNLTLGGTAAPAGLQWSLPTPTGFTAQATAGPALGTAKTLYCGDNATPCLAVEMNTATIPNGIVAKYVVQVGSSVVKGLYPLPVVDPIAASAEGNIMAVTSGMAYQLRVLAKSDINGDGTTNRSDINLMIDQALGRASCSNDQNGDGKCNLIDVLAIIWDSL